MIGFSTLRNMNLDAEMATDRKDGRMAEWLNKIRQRLRLLKLALTMHYPVSGADDDEGGDKGGDDDGNDDEGDKDKAGAGTGGGGDSDDEGDADEGDDDEEPKDPGPDWKKQARANETRAKKAERARDSALAKLRKHENENKSEREKELDKARTEAANKVREEASAERRQDRLENSVIRLAAKGIKIGEGDDATTARFRDPEDALLHLNRAIAEGEVDAEDIFTDEGKVKSDAVRDALAEILDSKSYLRAEAEGSPKPEKPKPEGGGDGGKGGDGSGKDKSLEDMSVEEHYQRIRKGNPQGASA